ncbi:MAG TPA: hypothetical protein VG897_16835, partial [Terriglobales bacterium]|nr:hypothetical protein [Terriglobales bacterium]
DIDLRKYAWRYAFTSVIRNVSGPVETGALDSTALMQEIRADVSAFICHGEPALRRLDAEFDSFQSCYCENYPAVGELRIHSMGSQTKFVTWTNLGYGNAEATLQEGQEAWPPELRLNLGAFAEAYFDGSLELRFVLHRSFSLTQIQATGVLADKTKVVLPTEIITKDEHTVIRMAPKVPLKEIGMQLTFGAQDGSPDVEYRLKGLRLLHFPSMNAGTSVKLFPPSAAARLLETAWADWIRRGQSLLQSRYGFIGSESPGVVPSLKEISSSTTPEFKQGVMQLGISDKAKASLRFDAQRRTGALLDVKVAICVTANIYCDLVVGLGTSAGDVVEERRQLKPSERTVISLDFRLSNTLANEFFVSFDVTPNALSPQTSSHLRLEKLLVSEAPVSTEPGRLALLASRLICASLQGEGSRHAALLPSVVSSSRSHSEIIEATGGKEVMARRCLTMTASKLLLRPGAEGGAPQAGPSAQQIADALDLLPITDNAVQQYRKIIQFVEQAGKQSE